MDNMKIFDKMIAKLTENPKTIVFTEGTDARILEASDRLLKDNFLKPILVGNVDEVKENCCDEVFAVLSEKDLQECEKIKKELGQEFCRRCGYCAPCPQGINIPSNFLFVNYLRKYGLASWAKDRYWAMSATAKDCVQCGLCESRCPYNLPIRTMLEKVAKEME